MWAQRHGSVKRLSIGLIGLALLWSSGADIAMAQATPPADTGGARERELRDQLKNILQELEELQQQKEGARPEEERPSIIKEPAEPVSPEVSAGPDIDLADMSIVSQRLQKRPEGISLSATVPAETDSQPTRTMKESLESLPGVVLRQANGPRDFSIMIRGQGAKTTFAVRDIKIYEDGFIQTQSDGLSRLDIHDPWFMRSMEVHARSLVFAVRQLCPRRHGPLQNEARQRHQRV